MIISASRRTDIPAFYSQWFMNRIRAGYALVENPFNPQQVTRVDLSPEAVDAIVFVTRNPGPLFQHLDELDKKGHRFCFQYTITGYPALLEPFVRGEDEALRLFCALSERVGPERLTWRFDPIVLSTVTPEEDVIGSFARIARRLRGRTRRVIVSFADYYWKVKRNFGKITARTGTAFFDLHDDPERLFRIGASLAGIARENAMAIYSCAEKHDLAPVGIPDGKCIDAGHLSEIFGIPIAAGRAKNQRKACGCVESQDIGYYDTCLHGCAYCYATRNYEAALRNRARHDPASACQIGTCRNVEPPGVEARQLRLL